MGMPQGCRCLLASRRKPHMSRLNQTHIRTRPQAPAAWEILVGVTGTLSSYTLTATTHNTTPSTPYTDTTMILPVLAWLLSLPACSDAFLPVHPPASALTCSSAARFSAYEKEVPPLALFSSPTPSSPSSSSSPSSTSSSSSSLLPLDPTTPALYTGRWEIKSSNELSTELGGFVTVEIDEGGSFRAIGHRKNDKGLLSSTVQVSRNGSFSLRGLASSSSSPETESGDATTTTTASTSTSTTTAPEKAAKASATSAACSSQQPTEGDRVVGVLTFEADQTEQLSSSVAGLGLPQSFLNRPPAVRDLSGKQREVLVTVVSMDTIILLFVERSKFYVLTRSTASSNSADAQAPTPLNAVLVTQLFSMLATAVAEALHSDLMHLLK